VDDRPPKDSEDPITSCSIITTAASNDVRFVHDRMPVIVNGSDAEAAWLDPDVELEGALELVRPLPAGLLCGLSRVRAREQPRQPRR
jgi:putative SOS response-associated peptidase YedK